MTNDELIRYITFYNKANGHPPTIREMADEHGVNEKTVRNRLRELAAAGRVTWRPGEHRTVQVQRANMKAKSIPM